MKNTSSEKLRRYYNKKYYLTACSGREGIENYLKKNGLGLTPYISRPFKLISVCQDQKILDVGCGRGEVVLHCAIRGAKAYGIDFSESAIKLAEDIRSKASSDIQNRVKFIVGNAANLPFSDNFFDICFLLDVVEHVNNNELSKILSEIHRVLKIKGTLIVHSTPNNLNEKFGLLFKKYIYKLFCNKKFSGGKREKREFDFLHINEQNYFSLKRHLNKAGFEENKVWFDTTYNVWKKRRNKTKLDKTFSFIYDFLHLDILFGHDLVAVSKK